MKASLHYIVLLVIISLSGIFIYQLFWITDLYHARQKQNKETIMRAIRDADHIELFDRADMISSYQKKLRETSSLVDAQGNFALSTKFPDKDSVQSQEQAFLPLDTMLYHNADKENHKMLRSTGVKVGNEYSSLSRLGLQMQQSLHEIIDNRGMPIRIAQFDSILTSHLRKEGLDLLHFIEIKDLEDNSILATTVPEHTDLSTYELHQWNYTTYHPKAYLVYTESTRWNTIRMMTGILISSLLILLILIISFICMIRFLLNQKTVEQLKDDFTHNVTHELKTPIAITYAAIEAMIHYNITDNKEKTSKYLHVCHEELQRLSGMVEQILSLSLEHKHEFKLKFEAIELKGLIHTIIEQQTIKSAKPFRVESSFNPDPIHLEADRTHLYHIISNLVDNAIKYADKDPFIRVDAIEVGNSIQIRITDNGIGISQENLPHIFDKFYRIPLEKGTIVKGYGIGLFYVRTMVQRHNGTIQVESSPGKGSSFIITLPQKK